MSDEQKLRKMQDVLTENTSKAQDKIKLMEEELEN